jgi:hypothetical protein
MQQQPDLFVRRTDFCPAANPSAHVPLLRDAEGFGISLVQ